MKTKINKFIALICLISNVSLFAQKDMDRYFNHLFSNKKMMGSVAISHNDSVIYKKTVGFANAETKKLTDENTKFRIGSVTKTYTAVLVLKAIEEQKIQLDTKLSQYYPQIKNADKITIEHLLKHRSGIFNFTEIEGLSEWQEIFHTQNDFINYFLNEKSNFAPGSAYQYSNTNYALLGFILEKLYQKTYAEILDEKISRPLLLKNTYYSFETDETKNEALSYNIQDQYVRNGKVNFSNHPASGGIVSTPIEVNKFLFALFNGKLITAKSLEKMLPKNKGEYGLGIEKLSFDDIEGYQHSGRVENYISDYWYFPKENLGIVSLTNASNINTDNIMSALLGSAYRKTPVLLNYKKVEGLSEKESTRVMGTYRKANETESITISSDGSYLVLQASQSGQDFVGFEYKGNNTFQYENIKLIFDPKKKEMQFEQDGIKEIYKKL